MTIVRIIAVSPLLKQKQMLMTEEMRAPLFEPHISHRMCIANHLCTQITQTSNIWMHLTCFPCYNSKEHKINAINLLKKIETYLLCRFIIYLTNIKNLKGFYGYLRYKNLKGYFTSGKMNVYFKWVIYVEKM